MIDLSSVSAKEPLPAVPVMSRCRKSVLHCVFHGVDCSVGSSQMRVGRRAPTPVPSPFASAELKEELNRTSIGDSNGHRSGVAEGVAVGSAVGWAPRNSLEMRLMASRAVARALFVRRAVAEARCRLIHPAMKHRPRCRG